MRSTLASKALASCLSLAEGGGGSSVIRLICDSAYTRALAVARKSA